jgi:hypothetical protein
MKDTNFKYLNDYIPNRSFYISNTSNIALLEGTINSFTVYRFLIKLDIGKDYVINIEYIYSMRLHFIDHPKIVLSKPIIINSKTNPQLLSNSRVLGLIDQNI